MERTKAKWPPSRVSELKDLMENELHGDGDLSSPPLELLSSRSRFNALSVLIFDN